MLEQINVATAPKTATFRMRINPEIRQKVQAVYVRYGLSLVETIDIFLQASLNASGFPVSLSTDNEEYVEAKAAACLMVEIQKGMDSVKNRS